MKLYNLKKIKKRSDNVNNEQKYEEIMESLPEREAEFINKFVRFYAKYTLEDVFTKPEVRREFEVWQNLREYSQLNYYVEGMNRRNPMIRVTTDDLMEELERNPRLKDHVLAYAKNELKENALMDKHFTVRAIETGNIDILYDHDTEVRENFCESFLGGIKTRKAELREEGKQLKNKHEKERSR